MSASAKLSESLHVNARKSPYGGLPKGHVDIIRYPVPDEFVPFDTDYPGYKENVTDFTVAKLLGPKRPEFADPEDISEVAPYFGKYQTMPNGEILNRTGDYVFDEKGYPKNPKGRTGMKGRGRLGRWGENKAADPIVSYPVLDVFGQLIAIFFCLITRGDNGELALPGGMLETGDSISNTLKKEFGEEACNTDEKTPEEKKAIAAEIDELFKNGEEIYKGYVDDPRNTDDAWMVTTCYSFHSKAFENFKIEAGSDAKAVQWFRFSVNEEENKHIKLYASHSDFIKLAIIKIKAQYGM
jgi:ADP-ribose pyrophosphatase